MPMTALVPVFDLDGTLVDSDAALRDAFVALGVPAAEVTFGHVLAEECDRLGIMVEDYVAVYDPSLVRPFDGVSELVAGLDRWAVCSNKHTESGRAELARLGWHPDVALFTEDFASGPKQLGPVLTALGLDASEVLFVGDTVHDRRCAAGVGCRFAWAGWNPRAAPEPGDAVAARPADVLVLCDA